MVEIVNGSIFIEGKETIDPTLIGYAIIDFAESQEKNDIKILLKDQDVFVDSLLINKPLKQK
jgi:hypothetical protein